MAKLDEVMRKLGKAKARKRRKEEKKRRKGGGNEKLRLKAERSVTMKKLEGITSKKRKNFWQLYQICDVISLFVFRQTTGLYSLVALLERFQRNCP